MIKRNIMEISNDIIKLFQNKNYEKYVLEIMNLSIKVFPGKYKNIEEQSHGECDFLEINTGEKFDAKLPFYSDQIKMLTDGKKHKPQIKKWIQDICNEAYEFDRVMLNDPKNLDVSELKLYMIMKEQIIRDNEAENIVFFIPYPVVTSMRDSIFLQFTANYLNSIYNQLKKEIDFTNRSIYVIYPSSNKNEFAIKDLKYYHTEYIQYDKLSEYFEHEAFFSLR
ncbi:hypothetical protein [uncultured Eubacterium sp.]|uniref:hypothetical protein n=1 Tax=uncultured Eubacterium sp. TaxID=165185 RepID=UPI002599936B|nr:hypothetical protein [uncultured Eubacterium sp.]